MFNVLTGLAMGIVIFAITIGVGTVVLQKFGASVADCGDGFTYNGNSSTGNLCYNDTDTSTGAYNPSTATVTTTSLQGDLGTSGLAGWTGAIIALAVGLLFIGALMGRKQR